MNKLRIVFSMLAAVLMAGAEAADWLQFRGPLGSGIASDAKPPTTWSSTQNVKWKAALPGAGTSSPIVVGDKLLLTCWTGGPGAANDSRLKRHLVCIERETGKILWSKAIEAEAQADRYDGFLQEHGYASQTPVSDGERVFVYFGKGGALAFDLEGNELWRASLGTESNAKGWGSGSSPILFKDKVIINASEESHAVYALDKATGKQLWKAEGGALAYAFGTPLLSDHGGRTDLLISLPNEFWALNPDTGKLRWFADTGLPGNIAPSVVGGDGVAFAFGGFPKLGAVALKLGGKDDVTSSNIVWKSNNSTYVPTPVLHEGRIYFASDTGFATCLDAKSGALVFKERLEGASASGRGGKPFYASAVLANGNVYAVSRRNGVFVFAAQPEFKLIAQNKLAGDDTDFNATPAISGRQLFLRSNKNLYCLESVAPTKEAAKSITRVAVVFSGGHETDPRDGGRPVVLVAGGLDVAPEVFREAFSHVQPAPGGTEPQPNQVRQNKDALLGALGKHGVTNERLDAVSDYYRYVRSRNELWPTQSAIAYALVQDGVVTGYELVSGGSGYTSAPSVSVPNTKGSAAQVKLAFGTNLRTNGSIAAITPP